MLKLFLQNTSGKPNLKLIYKGKTIAVIEAKTPDISLTDPKLKEQVLRYAELYRKNMGVEYYGVHNLPKSWVNKKSKWFCWSPIDELDKK